MKKCMCCMQDYSENQPTCPVCGYSEAQMKWDEEEFPEALAPETILGGRFILGRTLSVTDFSNIYISWDALLQKRVAIREYFPAGLGKREQGAADITFSSAREQQLFEMGRETFEGEAARLNRNQDIPGIVQVYRTIRENQTAYMVMEYLEGRTLQDKLEDEELTDRKDVDRIICCLAEILDAVHARGMVHYNLSPENVYLDSGGRIRLLDFGDAKRRVYGMMRRSTRILDLRYTAPEILQGEAGGAGSDLYSLGAIYYRMVTGKEPPQSRPRRKKKTGLKVVDARAEKAIQALTMPAMEKRPKDARTAMAWMEREKGNDQYGQK